MQVRTFTSTEFQGECQTRGVHLTLAALEHQEMSIQVKVTSRTFHTIAQSRMVHARVLKAFIHLALMYTADNIFLLLPIKDPLDKNGDTIMAFNLETGKKPSVSQYVFYFSMCCTKSYCTCWDKDVKYSSPSIKSVLVSSLEFYSIRKGILSTYHTNGR